MNFVNDDLPLEYKLLNGCARRNLDISNLVNDSGGFCIIRVLSFCA